jgi:hypothetical protein
MVLIVVQNAEELWAPTEGEWKETYDTALSKVKRALTIG